MKLNVVSSLMTLICLLSIVNISKLNSLSLTNSVSQIKIWSPACETDHAFLLIPVKSSLQKRNSVDPQQTSQKVWNLQLVPDALKTQNLSLQIAIILVLSVLSGRNWLLDMSMWRKKRTHWIKKSYCRTLKSARDYTKKWLKHTRQVEADQKTRSILSKICKRWLLSPKFCTSPLRTDNRF